MSNSKAIQIVSQIASTTRKLSGGKDAKGVHAHRARKAVAAQHRLTADELRDIETADLLAFLEA